MSKAVENAPIECSEKTANPPPLTRQDSAHQGVAKIEATNYALGKKFKYILYVSLALVSLMYAMDVSTTGAYLTFATSSFGKNSLLSSVLVVQYLMIAIGKPIIAKIADVMSRATAYCSVWIFYVIGYIVIASAHNVATIAGGIVIYSIGYAGLQILTQIVVADLTTLKWRALITSLISFPFVISSFVGPNISASIIEHSTWRWGYGMFTILVTATVLPIILTLSYAERKSRLMAYEKGEASVKLSLKEKFQAVFRQLDIIGLGLLGAAVALIVLPLTLSQTVKHGWKDGAMIAMIVIGSVILIIFVIWNVKFASHPVIPSRFLRNIGVLGAAGIGFFSYLTYYLLFAYLYTFVLVVKPWTLLGATYFMETQNVTLTVFGCAGGLAMVYLQRYKHILIVGLCILELGVGLQLHCLGENASTVEFVWSQILQGIGGGFVVVSAQVGGQASVAHADIAMATAFILLFAWVGGAVGSAIAGAIWTNSLPKNLLMNLPVSTAEQRAQYFGNITAILDIPKGSPIREGIDKSFVSTMRTIVIVGVTLNVPLFAFAVFMPNWFLGDRQSANEEASEAMVDAAIRTHD